MNVLSLCDLTGNMVRPWLEAGHSATIVDLQHPAGVTYEHGGMLTKIGGDLLNPAAFHPNWQPLTFDLVFAFPPCTHLANSGTRWMQAKGLPALIEALTLVNRCREICEASGAPYMIENPVGQLSTYWRKPDHLFDPCEYGGYLPDGGDRYTKKTCLWTGNGFVMPPKRPVEPVEGSKMHRLSPGPERANLRSETPMGFARAVFEANTRQAVSA